MPIRLRQTRWPNLLLFTFKVLKVIFPHVLGKWRSYIHCIFSRDFRIIARPHTNCLIAFVSTINFIFGSHRTGWYSSIFWADLIVVSTSRWAITVSMTASNAYVCCNFRGLLAICIHCE